MSAGTDGYGYGCPRVRMGTDIASAGTDGHGYNSHTREALYFICRRLHFCGISSVSEIGLRLFHA